MEWKTFKGKNRTEQNFQRLEKEKIEICGET